jgi:hypothetical protein
MSRPAPEIRLSTEEKEILSRWRRSSKTEQRMVERAIPISTSEGCTRLWKSEIQFDGIFEGLGVQPLNALALR